MPIFQGMGPEDKVQAGMTIPGLDFQGTYFFLLHNWSLNAILGPPDIETGRKKQPFSKPIPRSFQV